MYAVKYEVMFMPVVYFCETREEAEEVKSMVMKRVKNIEVTIEGDD